MSFANDANAAAFGEFWVGSGSEYHSIVLFTLGTGVGGGIIIGDLSIDGENSHGSELGHMIIDYNDTARLCGCGQRGHLEAYASAKGVIQRTLEALEQRRTARCTSAWQQAGEMTPLMVAEEAEAGDESGAADRVGDGTIPGDRHGQRVAHGRSGCRDLWRGDEFRWPRFGPGGRIPGTDSAGDSSSAPSRRWPSEFRSTSPRSGEMPATSAPRELRRIAYQKPAAG